MMRSYRFCDYRIDERNRRLSRGKNEIKLRGKEFAILLHFVKNPHRLIRKQEFLDECWTPGDDEPNEENVKGQVSNLRKVLVDDDRKPKIIETVHGYGYRFIADVAGDKDPPLGWLLVVGSLVVVLAIAGSYIFYLKAKLDGSARVMRHQGKQMSLQKLWKPFLLPADKPLVIFSNGNFVGRPETGIRYYNPDKGSNSGKPQGDIQDEYTGVGEVLAVHELDVLFALLGRELDVKRGQKLSLDDCKETQRHLCWWAGGEPEVGDNSRRPDRGIQLSTRR